VYSWTRTFRAFDPAFEADLPYVVAIVELAEGCRIPTRLVLEREQDVHVGMSVELDFVCPQQHPLWVFRPVAEAAGDAGGASESAS
jgi:uncharacterized OB-fold protein